MYATGERHADCGELVQPSRQLECVAATWARFDHAHWQRHKGRS